MSGVFNGNSCIGCELIGSFPIDCGGCGNLMPSREEFEQLKKDKDAKQAEIDSLMFEYCPDEMTKEQIENWVKHQVIAGKYTKGGN